MIDETAEALLDSVLAECGPGAAVCWHASGLLASSGQQFARLFGLNEPAPIGTAIAALWEEVRARCTADPGDLVSAFASQADIEVRLEATPGPESAVIRLSRRTVSSSLGLEAMLARDVTEHKRAEADLVESETRYRTLYELIPHGVVLYRKEGRVLDVNPAALSILGRRREEMVGNYTIPTEWRCIREDGSEFPGEAYPIAAALRSGTTVRNVVMGVFNPRYEEFVWINVDAVPLFGEGVPEQPHGVFACFTDITESRRLRQALVQTQKMEALGRLTGGIAHDFNNILGSILGFAELARLRNAEADPKLDGFLEQIDVAGARARDLVRQLLVFSRGDSTIGARPAPLMPMIKEVLKMLRRTIPATIHIRLASASDALVVRIDPLHVQQMLMNLMLNARDAMPGGGEILVVLDQTTVEGECVICGECFAGDWIEISVSDTGCGIAAEHIGLVFQPFFTTKEVGEGSGMGLAVVAGLLRTYGGHALVRSKRGEGSTFQLLLPTTSGAGPSSPRSSPGDRDPTRP